MFRNRLQKVYRHIGKQAARQGVSCYRIYDHDLPEAPFIIERYGDQLYVSEYKRRHGFDDAAHTGWLQSCLEVMHDITGVPVENIWVKTRQRKEGRQGQYQKLDERKSEFVVQEGGLSFIVNLSDYLDTGLFLDHRSTRGLVRERAAGKDVLNLFCYTGSFSVYALAGGARRVHSVDLSKTYLAWTGRNVALNFPDAGAAHEAIHADALRFLRDGTPESYDLIVLDPPTFSNSKRMDDILDVQRDHVAMINDCLRLLRPGGMLYFSTNYTRFELDAEHIKGATVLRDITKATTPFDFAGKLNRYCFYFEK
ncbi:SAM-dependent methyltransferase [Flaviaesturariibacter flavus]|uniref:SAM-dependent methyltransferase n=2 Tax=Flaviaesturariibacter flavus TaxID=2502780 RepID=A0A4V6NAX6_9BACT|nr:SAM-dependent methyltransferase [Flaviaesturariibacter flavus]